MMFDGVVSENSYVVAREADKCCIFVFSNTAVMACCTMRIRGCPATRDSVVCTTCEAAATAFKHGGNP